MRTYQTFNPKSVIDYYKKNQFLKIADRYLMDFLPDIYESELHILKSWEKHFKSIGTPYAITTTTRKYKDDRGRPRIAKLLVLWKERRI